MGLSSAFKRQGFEVRCTYGSSPCVHISDERRDYITLESARAEHFFSLVSNVKLKLGISRARAERMLGAIYLKDHLQMELPLTDKFDVSDRALEVILRSGDLS